MNIISGSTNNIFYTKGYNFDDRVSIDPETGLANLMVNGNAEFGSTYNINAGGVSRTGSYEGSYCFVDNGYRGYSSDLYIPVNTGDTYLLSAYFKSMGTPQSAGYAGLAHYDEDFNFIDLRNNGDVGNTTLASAVNNGDTTITLTDASVNVIVVQMHLHGKQQEQLIILKIYYFFLQIIQSIILRGVIQDLDLDIQHIQIYIMEPELETPYHYQQMA